MLELPEVRNIAAQLGENLTGSVVAEVCPPSRAHKFCWYNGDPAAYDAALRGSRVTGAEGFGIYVELCFDNGCKLCFNDGVNPRLMVRVEAPKNYQLMLLFTDGRALVFTVAMYGGIVLHRDDYDNEYYAASRAALSPFSPAFEPYFYERLAQSKPNLSAKAFLATEQRFAGLGNGVLQDILFAAGLHPKRKLSTLDETEKAAMLRCTVSTLRAMCEGGGRDTEKDIFGCPGGYPVIMCKNALATGCPRCGGPVTKEAYLGGSVYYCPRCQPLASR